MKDFDPLLLKFSILGFVVESPRAIGAAGYYSLGPRGQDHIHIFSHKILVHVISHILQNTAATDLVNQGIIHVETIQKIEGFQGGFIFPKRTHAPYKIYVFGLFVSFPFKIFRFIFRVDVGVFLEHLVHSFERWVTGTDIDHILSHLFDDVGHVYAGGATFCAGSACGALKKGFNKLVV